MNSMHETMSRLYEAAWELKELQRPSDIARLLEESPQTLKNWEARGISSAGILKAQKTIGCRAEWLANNLGSMYHAQGISEPKAVYLVDNDEFPSIRRVTLRLQAGVTGFAVENDTEDVAPIVFRREWFERNGYKPARLIAVRVRGDSMEPGLYEDDTVVINTAQTEPVDGSVFAVNYEGEAMVKRMIRDAGQWWLSSDNPNQSKHPRKLANGTAIIIGQVVHKQSERI